MSKIYHDNFEAALIQLKEFCLHFNGSNIHRAGIIQAFEFTYEQAWKTIQKIAGDEGVVIVSPKKAFQWAISAGIIPIEDELVWIEILSDRNLTTHTYREAMAEQVSNHIEGIYLNHFIKLLESFKKFS